MNCDNTISAGFQFMLGKFLFDLTLFAIVALGVIAYCAFLIWYSRRK